MEPVTPDESTARPHSPLSRLKVWHLALLVGFVAVAIAQIQDQRMIEPALIALAGAGFAAYWVLGWMGWRLARRFEGRIGAVALLLLYLAGMAALFLVATVAYLVIEHAYLGGTF